MIHHSLSRLPVACFLIVCGFTSVLFGQQLPLAIVTSPAPAPQRGTIDTFVDEQVTKVAGADPVQASSARIILIAEVGRQGVTQAFLDQYADSVNVRILPVTQNKDVRARLNAAIVAARIAAKADNGRLAPITEAFIKDNSDAVVLWGLQSAKYVVPALLRANDLKTANAIGQEVVQAAKDHVTSSICEEAYKTVTLETSGPTLSGISTPMLQGFLPNCSTLYEYRVTLYDDAAPTQPLADAWASTFLTKGNVWSAQTSQQQAHVLQLMLSHLKGLSKQYAAAKPAELLDVIKRTSQAFDVVARSLNNTPLRKAAADLSSISNDTDAAEIDIRITALETALKTIPASSTAVVAPSPTPAPQ